LRHAAFCDEAHCFVGAASSRDEGPDKWRLPTFAEGYGGHGKQLPQGWKWKIKVIAQGAMMEGEEGTMKYAKCAKRQASV